jgi:cellulose synthase/poly-beta-1,6-N-acetylglucosamine synthase-like glycosyltransferase
LILLVPAHNEELLLERCLQSLQQLRYPRELTRIVVVADNCSDRTPDIARAGDVECLERHAPQERGKPQALAWAMSRLPVSQYDGVVIVDADTVVAPDFAAQLAATAAAPALTRMALQPYNGVSNSSENALTCLAAVLSQANHGLAYVLKTRAGITVPLSAGMCVGTGLLEHLTRATSSMCEDWELYARLTEQGVAIRGVPKARIYAQEAHTLRASATQRRRWTAGKLQVLRRYLGPLLRSRNIGVHQKLDTIGELAAPGPVLHVGIVAVAGAVALALHAPGASWMTAALAMTLLRPVAYAARAIATDAEPWRVARALVFLPVYAVWRLGAAIAAFRTLGARAWVRTARHAPGDLAGGSERVTSR